MHLLRLEQVRVGGAEMGASYDEVVVSVGELELEDQRKLLEHLASLLRHRVSGTKGHSILELRGLGKRIWEGVHAQQYVDRERG